MHLYSILSNFASYTLVTNGWQWAAMLLTQLSKLCWG